MLSVYWQILPTLGNTFLIFCYAILTLSNVEPNFRRKERAFAPQLRGTANGGGGQDHGRSSCRRWRRGRLWIRSKPGGVQRCGRNLGNGFGRREVGRRLIMPRFFSSRRTATAPRARLSVGAVGAAGSEVLVETTAHGLLLTRMRAPIASPWRVRLDL